MKTKNTIPVLLTALVMGAILLVAGCSKENDVELREAETAQAGQEFSPEGSQLKSSHSDQNRLLAQIRRATAKYQNIDVAFGDDYIIGSPCVDSEDGGMGIHLVNFALIMNGEVNPEKPEALVYEPMKNGRMRLVAIEYIIPAAAWEGDGIPMLGNQVYDDHRAMTVDDSGNPVNAKGGPPFPHYQLHVWVWKNNPLGMYEPYNPTVSCKYAPPPVEDPE